MAPGRTSVAFSTLTETKCHFATMFALGLALVGCGGGEDDEAGALTVSAAASLTEAFEAYGDETERDEKFSFAGSADLAAQIRQGAPVDVFASANGSLPDDLHEEGLVEEPVTFIANRLVVAVPSDSISAELAGDLEGIDPLEQLADAGDTDIVIGAKGVPVGDYARDVLDRAGPAARDPILSQVRSEEPDAKGIVAKLTTGAADAGFVYASDVVAAGGDLVALEIPPEFEPDVSYGIAVVSDSDSPEDAREFIDGLLDGTGRDALLDAGFIEPKGD